MPATYMDKHIYGSIEIRECLEEAGFFWYPPPHDINAAGVVANRELSPEEIKKARGLRRLDIFTEIDKLEFNIKNPRIKNHLSSINSCFRFFPNKDLERQWQIGIPRIHGSYLDDGGCIWISNSSVFSSADREYMKEIWEEAKEYL